MAHAAPLSGTSTKSVTILMVLFCRGVRCLVGGRWCVRENVETPLSIYLKILQHTGNHAGATQALEMALSLDFEINDTPTFNALRGTLLYHKGEYEAALQALKTAVAAAGGTTTAAAGSGGGAGAGGPVDALGPVKSADASKPGAKKVGKGQLSAGEHVGLYLQLAQTYVKMRDAANAKQTIREALQKFGDTPSGASRLRRRCCWRTRTPRRPSRSCAHFLAAKAHMAQLYLSLRGNRRAFARCYEEVVEAMPSVQSYMHLGDAYAGIQEPDKAIVAYEKARAMDPNNAELSVKIGRTLVRAIDCLIQAIKRASCRRRAACRPRWSRTSCGIAKRNGQAAMRSEIAKRSGEAQWLNRENCAGGSAGLRLSRRPSCTENVLGVPSGPT